ncbi:MAG: hypothetical protein MUP14_03875 [Dehalococcoidia bacterium]|nr:hypothetical protein [Dehalococcoidia bacterium]
MRDLLELLDRLHRARLIVASLDAEVAEAKRKWEEDHQGLLNRRLAAQDELNMAVPALREAAIAAFQETGDLAPAPGIKIVMRTRLDYEADEAKRWAMNHKMALSLDVREFEKLAKAAPANFDFVRQYQEPAATIATDLGPVLDEVNHANP